MLHARSLRPVICWRSEEWQPAVALRYVCERFDGVERSQVVRSHGSWLNIERCGPVGVNHFSLTGCIDNATLRLRLFGIVNDVCLDFYCRPKLSTCRVPTIPVDFFLSLIYLLYWELVVAVVVYCPWPYLSDSKLIYSICGIDCMSCLQIWPFSGKVGVDWTKVLSIESKSVWSDFWPVLKLQPEMNILWNIDEKKKF